MKPIIIEIHNLKKSFREKAWRRVQALHGISLMVTEGEAFGFIGPNGAGKTTTIKILTGNIRPTEGNATIFGKPVSKPSSRTGMAYVPENPYLYDYLTPLEILQMGGRMHGLKGNNLTDHYMNWLERFGIAQVAKKQIRQFSKGMTQRVALAHALACKPRLLILDEPLSGLDPIGRREVSDILLEYHQQGGTIFFSSHILHDVERLADRFGIIHKGLLRAINTPLELGSIAPSNYLIVSEGSAPLENGISQPGQRWVQRITHDRLWEALDQLQRANHVLIEAKPEGASLEQAFLKFVRNDSA
jgi:ABC-2 type transport system ATP-binding protein